MAKSKNYLVLKHPKGGWGVKRQGAGRFSVRTDTQRQGIDRGRKLATTSSGDLTVQGRDGRWRSKDSYGRDPFPPRDTEH